MLIITLMMNGFGAGIMWVALGEYFANCATNKTKGFYFGFFWSMYQGT